MKLALLGYLFFLLTISPSSDELINIDLGDGVVMTGKLYLPEQVDEIRQVVVFVHGTGPGTYLNKRQIGSTVFSYFDTFGKEFQRRGIAMFSYNKRGVELVEEPPTFERVDREAFKKVVPSVEVQDLAKVIRCLRADPRLKQAQVTLLGWSEGTIIASMVAEDPGNQIAALYLAGYAHESMFEIIKWQFSGAASMINLRPGFDTNGDGDIDQAEYEWDGEAASRMRALLQNGAFGDYDRNKDGVISSADFKLMMEPSYRELLQKIDLGEEDWIWNNYFHVSIEWLDEHFDLEPNRTRLLRLKLPIYVFHGEADANVDAAAVRDLSASFQRLRKMNLKTFIFPFHDHDLNFLQWIRSKKQPAGIAKIFAVAQSRDDAER